MALDRHPRPLDLRNEGWICDDLVRQHGNARALRACMLWHLSQLICSQHRDADPPSPAHASAVCDTEAAPADVQTTSPRSCRQRPFTLNEVVDYRLALQAICSVAVIPTSSSFPCATSSSELSEISPHNLLETRTTLLDIRLRRAICPSNLARCHVCCASR